MRSIKFLISLAVLLLAGKQTTIAQVCNNAGNLIIYSNYDGGIININVDVNIPNLKIGICTYEAAQVNITGTFSSNVTQVIYAGYNGSNDNCNLNFTTTAINAPVATATAINFYPAVGSYTPYHGFGNANLDGCYQCDTTVSSGGVNSPDEVVYYFTQQTGGVFRSHNTQYACWTNSTFNVSAGGNCCIVPSISVTCVAPNAPVSSTSNTNLAFCAAQNTTLSATSSGTVYWYATNTSTTVLNSGNTFVTPTLTAGTHTFYAGAVNSCSNSATRAAITVTVNPLPTVGISSSNSVVCAGQIATLTASGASSYTWNTTATTTNIVIAPSVNTTYTVTGQSAIGCKKTATINITVSACTGIDEDVNGVFAMSVSPNPSKGMVQVATDNTHTKQITITDLTGKVVLTSQTNEQKITLNIESLQKGIYILQVEQEKQTKRLKLLIE